MTTCTRFAWPPGYGPLDEIALCCHVGCYWGLRRTPGIAAWRGGGGINGCPSFRIRGAKGCQGTDVSVVLFPRCCRVRALSPKWRSACLLASGLLFASDARRPATRVRACRTFVRMRIEGVQSSERERMKIETLYARWRAPRRFFFFFALVGTEACGACALAFSARISRICAGAAHANAVRQAEAN